MDCFASGGINCVVESTGMEGLIVSFGFGRNEFAVGGNRNGADFFQVPKRFLLQYIFRELC